MTVTIYAGASATARSCRRAPSTARARAGRRTATALAAGKYTAQADPGRHRRQHRQGRANTFTIDSTKPTAIQISSTNKAGGIAGRPEAGDTLTYDFSEAMLPASILAGWTGASSASVTVAFANAGADDTISVTGGANAVHLGTVATGGNFVTGAVNFTGSTMVRSADGKSITITLGTTSGDHEDRRGHEHDLDARRGRHRPRRQRGVHHRVRRDPRGHRLLMTARRSHLISSLTVVAVALAVLAAAVLGGGDGSARAAVGAATGPLVRSSAGTGAILVARDLRPGGGRTGDVTITNVGDSPGAFAMTASRPADSSTTARLSSVLGLQIADVTPGRATSVLYSGRLADLARIGPRDVRPGRRAALSLHGRLPGRPPGGHGQPVPGGVDHVTFHLGRDRRLTADAGRRRLGPRPAPAPAHTAQAPGTKTRRSLAAAVQGRQAPGRPTTGGSPRRCAAACAAG